MKESWCVKLVHCGNRNIARPNDTGEKSVFFIPMGLFSIASVLKKHDIDVEILHLDLEPSENIENLIDWTRVAAVGLDCHWVNQGLAVMDTARCIKEIKPGIFVFIGGYTASFFATEILENYPEVDAVIRGDGEIPVLQLCQALRTKDSLTKVQNLVYRGQDQEILINDFSYRATAGELDQFDFTALDILKNWQFYRSLSLYWTGWPALLSHPLFMLEIGRGCIYTCSTCGGSARAQFCISRRKGQVVRRPDTVAASVKKALHFGFTCFLASFEFENSDDWYIRFFKSIKAQQLNINFVYESWGIPSKPLIDIIAESCEHALIVISPETADVRLRRKNKDIRKAYTNQQLEECLDYIGTRDNLNFQLYFGYFLPFDTGETVFNTMDYILKLFLEYADLGEIIYMNFTTDPCSPLFLHPGKYQIMTRVQTFSDFIDEIKNNYTTEKKKDRGVTLLSWPANLTEKKAVDLANKIYYFNRILHYKKSLLYLLEDNPAVSPAITGYLGTVDFSLARAADFTWDKVRDMLLRIAETHLPGSQQIKHLVEEEYRRIVGARWLKKPPAGFHTLGSKDTSSLSQHQAEQLEDIFSTIKRDREDITVDFNID